MASAAPSRARNPQLTLFEEPSKVQFPSTRYQGSKRKLLASLRPALTPFAGKRALDLYSGTASVSLLLRTLGCCVTANDYLAFNALTARVLLSHLPLQVDVQEIAARLTYLLEEAPVSEPMWVSENFKDVFFTEVENEQIDRFCQNVTGFDGAHADVYVYCVGQALLMKRPYNLFHRANLHMRLKDVKRSFGNAATWETPIAVLATRIATQLSSIRLDVDQLDHHATQRSATELADFSDDFDLVYMDPPYLNARGLATDYDKFYHFLDGLIEYKRFSDVPASKPHLPPEKRTAAWATPQAALSELRAVSQRWPDATLALSYRSDGLPTLSEIEETLGDDGRTITRVPLGGYKYALAHANETAEVVVLAAPRHAEKVTLD